MTIIKHIFPSNITKDQSKDTALALVLLFLLISLFSNNFLYVKFGFAILIIAMVFPLLFRHLETLWLGLSHLLGIFALHPPLEKLILGGKLYKMQSYKLLIVNKL
jgi:hypothetical protein